MPGVPYLKNSSIDYFIISIILLVLVQEYGNLSQKYQKRDSGTFYFEATCGCGVIADREGWKGRGEGIKHGNRGLFSEYRHWPPTSIGSHPSFLPSARWSLNKSYPLSRCLVTMGWHMSFTRGEGGNQAKRAPFRIPLQQSSHP